MSTPWWILGTGAIGSLWAVRLQQAGRDVRLLRSPKHAPASAYGEIIFAAGETEASKTFRFPQYPVSSCPHGVRRVLVCTKAYQVLDALQALGPALAVDAEIVLLVNGMGFQDDVVQLFPQQRIYAAVTTVGAWLRGPLHVVPAGDGDMILGALPASEHANTASKALAAFLNNNDVPVAASDTIDEVQWRKVCINAAINGLTAIHQCRNGELLSHPAARPVLDLLINELVEISNARLMHQLAAALETDIHRVIRNTASNYSSTYKDVQQGRTTEIDYINGYVCTRAAKLGIDVPENASIVAAVRTLTGKGQRT